MQRPHVTLKLATSLDGRIATARGESRWITGPQARAEVQRMRAAHDVVMVGAGTARADDPELLARTEPAPAKQPMRAVVTSRFEIPFEGRLYTRLEDSPLIVFGRENASPARQAILEGAGARVERVPALGARGLHMGAVLARLAELGATRVLVEGGGELAAHLLAAGGVDRIEWFRAPILLGGDARPAVATLALEQLSEAPAFRRVALRELGPDVWESYEQG